MHHRASDYCATVCLKPVFLHVDWKLRIEWNVAIQANLSGTNQLECGGTRAETKFGEGSSQTDTTRVIRRGHVFVSGAGAREHFQRCAVTSQKSIREAPRVERHKRRPSRSFRRSPQAPRSATPQSGKSLLHCPPVRWRLLQW